MFPCLPNCYIVYYVGICQLCSAKAPHPGWSFKTHASSAAPA